MAFISPINRSSAPLLRSIRIASISILCFSLALGCFSPTLAQALTEESDVLFGQTASEHGIPAESAPPLLRQPMQRYWMMMVTSALHDTRPTRSR